MRRRQLIMRVWAAATAAAVAATVAGCAQARPATSQASPTGGAFPVTAGSVTLDRQPTRIVSLAPTTTEMLFAIGAGKQVTAADELSNYPADAPKTDLSGFKPNAEAIAGRNPDLVVLSNDTNKIVDQLRQLKVPVYLAPAAQTLDDSYAQLLDLGRLTGHSAQATEVVRRMRDEVANQLASAAQRRAESRERLRTALAGDDDRRAADEDDEA